MTGLAWLVAAASLASLGGCAMQSFDYDATVMFSPSAGPARLNHSTITPGAVWSASYSSFADAVRNPSIVELAGQTIPIGPEACAALCRDCDFDRASLAFSIDASHVAVTGTCGDGDHSYELR